jgi:cation diffusion facilitator family transporter
MSCCDCKVEPNTPIQRKVLVVLLAINAAMFFGESVFAILADSTGLLADSLDMLADAFVYGVALYAVARSNSTKVAAARWSGYFQIILAGSVLLDAIRRFAFGSEPESGLIMAVGFVALVANFVCLKLISKHRDGEVHMRASWIFSKNDVIANLGVIAAGFMVQLSGSRLPDLFIGIVIALLVLRGGIDIVRDAARESECSPVPSRRVIQQDSLTPAPPPGSETECITLARLTAHRPPGRCVASQ